MSTVTITHEGAVRIPVGTKDGERVAILTGDRLSLLELRDGAWMETEVPRTEFHCTSSEEALTRKIAGMILDLEDSDLTSIETAAKIIRMVRDADRAKSPSPGAKYIDTATGDEYEMGTDMQWRRVVK